MVEAGHPVPDAGRDPGQSTPADPRAWADEARSLDRAPVRGSVKSASCAGAGVIA